MQLKYESPSRKIKNKFLTILKIKILNPIVLPSLKII